MTAWLTAISGLIGIAALILKYWYWKKQREPYKIRLSFIFEAFKKWKVKTDEQIIKKDTVGLSSELNELNDDVSRLREAGKIDGTPK
jgi:hypothetical protein